MLHNKISQKETSNQENSNIIEIKNLTKTFGSFTAVNRVSFNIRQGEILGFLGPNGAGKTTTIKMINGLLRINGGQVIIKGMDAVRQRKKVKKIMGYMSQKFSLYPLLNTLENIEFFGGISGLSRAVIKEKQMDIRQRIEPALLKQKVSDVPPGIRQKVALFVCLMTDPEIIFLDEPTSGVDPEVRRNFWFDIYRLKKEGKTILVSTHNLDEAEYADRVLILHRGVLLMQGEPAELLKIHNKPSVDELFRYAIMADGKSGKHNQLLNSDSKQISNDDNPIITVSDPSTGQTKSGTLNSQTGGTLQ